MTTFVSGVNRILRNTSIIAHDDVDITSFSNAQHKATIQLAMAAIQSTITDLVSDRIIPYEESDGTITCVTSQRVYSLPSDFVQFKGDDPFLLQLDSNGKSANVFVTETDEEDLRRDVLDYREQTGEPINYYWVNTTTKKIGLYPVPDNSKNGTQYRFPYERTVQVFVESDSLPFQNQQEDFCFLDMAARRFDYLIKKVDTDIQTDPIYRVSKTSLLHLMRAIKQPAKYGYHYGKSVYAD